MSLIKKFFSDKKNINILAYMILIVSSITFLALSVSYMLIDKPIVSLLSFVIGIILLSSALGIQRSFSCE
ncbi:MAG: hypothetical protein GU359_03505 [Desulfurococcales archaeon]|jgi:hypothetical protein|nr:hypothetical protein [Desulfurococcales archaeon]